MTASMRLRKPLKGPVTRRPRGTKSDVWVYLWTWTLDPKAGAAEIREYKKVILKPLRQLFTSKNKKNKGNIPPIPNFRLHPIWEKIRSEGSLKLTLKLMIIPAPPGGGGNLIPPTPPQPPPPPIAGN